MPARQESPRPSETPPGTPAGDSATARARELQVLLLRRARVLAARVRDRGRPIARRTGASLARLSAAAVYQWRRSLQLQVVTATMVLGVVATTVVAAFLAGQVSDRLLDARRAQAFSDAAQASEEFQELLDSSDSTTEAKVEATVRRGLDVVSGTGGDSAVGVLLLRQPLDEGDGTEADEEPVATQVLPGFVVGQVAPSTVPADLRRAVQSGSAQQSASVALVDTDGSEPGLVVGQRVTVPQLGGYELYFVVTLQREQETLESVQQVLALGMGSLVLLLGAIAFVVTRQVVRPVRQAAAVAVRLSDGRLDERMPERGEDDLARLARSFNEMAASLQDQIEQMEELSRLQRRFVSDVSHELRTPLTTIRMAGEVLYDSRGTFEPAVARSSELLSTQLDRFEELLADLLEISRFDAGAAALEAEPVDVASVVVQVVELAVPLAERRGSELRTHLPTTPAMAEVDARRVERVVRNLVINAIEHGEGRPVDVWLAANADAVAVLVRDQGVGLRPSDRLRVFDRFWRADPARARTTGGTGLGLAIALEDAHLHGGRLEAWGEVGEGAAFRLTLPRRAGSSVEVSPLPLGPDGPGDRRSRPVTVSQGAVPLGGSGAPAVLPHGLDRRLRPREPRGPSHD